MDNRFKPAMNAMLQSKRLGGMAMTKRIAEYVLLLGFVGIGLTLALAFLKAPSVSINAFESPDAQRIFYWHVPVAWAHSLHSASSFSVQQCGSFDGRTLAGECMLQAQKPGLLPD